MATALQPKTIFITVPNSAYVQCSNGVMPVKIGQKRPFTMAPIQPSPTPANLVNNSWLPAMPVQRIKYENVDDDDDDDYEYDDVDQNYGDPDQPPRKRERLTHLTPEEKLFRRKMKNRIAAQSARDRKKALMIDLEESCRRLEEDNETLTSENMKLREEQSSLAEENERLRKMLEERNSRQDDARTVSAFGPAESINVPLPKEQAKAELALAWLLASALIQLCSNYSVSSSKDQLPLSTQLQLMKQNGSLTVEQVLSRSPPHAIEKLRALIRSYKMTSSTKPP